jgi:hypothetical protein
MVEVKDPSRMIEGLAGTPDRPSGDEGKQP